MQDLDYREPEPMGQPEEPRNLREPKDASPGSCAIGGGASVGAVSSPGRVARALAGVLTLGLGGALSTRALPGRIALWPLALVPTWFGISHLIAAMVGYDGCPELGAIPTVIHGRPIGSRCRMWSRLDARLDGRAAAAPHSR